MSEAPVPPRITVLNLSAKAAGVPKAALIVGCSTRSIWRLLSTGELKSIRIGRRTLVTIESIDAFVARGGTK